MPNLARPRAGELAQHAVYVRDALRAVALQHRDEALHHPRDDLGVVKGAVVVEFGQAQMLGHDVQLVALQLRQQALGEHQRVEDDRLEPYARCGSQAAAMKPVSKLALCAMMGRSPAKSRNGAHGLRLRGRTGDVAVPDAGQLA